MDHATAENLTPTPVSFQNWVSITSSQFFKDDYVKHAINLAWELTNSLSQLVKSGHIKLYQIAAEKITVHAAALQSIHSIKSVEFHDTPQTNPLLEIVAETIGEEPFSIYQPAVCVALGVIFFDLFSMGQSNATDINLPFLNGVHNNTNSLQENDDDSIMMPRGKRVAADDPTRSASPSSSKSSRAKVILDVMGVPKSICRLVCDLLDAGDGQSLATRTAITSLQEVLLDLKQMKDDPEHFLIDRTDPQKALDDACVFVGTDKHLFGRENELGVLMNSMGKIATHVKNPQPSTHGFLGNVALLHGYPGSGKSSCLEYVKRSCAKDGWFVLNCHFSKHIRPEKALTNSFNDFCGKVIEPNNGLRIDTMVAIHEVCTRIYNTVDAAGFDQLCDLAPNFPKLCSFSLPPRSSNLDQAGISSSSDKIGTVKKRLASLFHTIFRSLCESGYPVLLSLDDLHWCDATTMEKISNFLSYNCNSDAISNTPNLPKNQGMLVVGSFRSNEMNDTIKEGISVIENSVFVETTKIAVGELTEDHLTQLLSTKLCLPPRYTKRLASTVKSKTRGNPFFCTQFARSIIDQYQLLEFSVRARRWIWDDDAVEKLTISEGVADLLTTTFSQLPSELMQTVKVISCLGSQIEESTVELMNNRNGVLPFDMHGPLDQAIKEGILERNGCVYHFTHDIVHSTIYNLIPNAERQLHHITIGATILSQADNSPSIYCLAVDQINIYIKGSAIDTEEKAQYASVNASAAKFALAAISLEQARSYIDMGMALLADDHWGSQYQMSLVLYKMLASVCFMCGDTITLSSCLDEIMTHAQSFEDSLSSSGLLSKLLAASSKYSEAIGNCLSVLSVLGEDFPENIETSTVETELVKMKTNLEGINSFEKVKLFPLMANKSKLNCMQFLSMMSVYCVISKPMLLPLVSARMVSITNSHGFCDDSIVGIVTCGWSLFTFSPNDITIAHQMIKVGKALIEESPNKNTLLARLTGYIGWLQVVVEPVQSIVDDFADRYKAGMAVGDIESAMLSRWSHCAASFHVGKGLEEVSKNCAVCIHQAVQYQQNIVIDPTITILRACISLTGKVPPEASTLEMKSYEDLDSIGQSTNNGYLLYQNMLNEVARNFWERDFSRVVELSGGFPSAVRKEQHILESNLFFFEGLASFWLLRQYTYPQPQWVAMGKSSLIKMSEMEEISQWNYENKTKLLQAEKSYTDGYLVLAEKLYKESIVSAKAHRFIHEEALALEMYGMYLVENLKAAKGLEQLDLAREKYLQWGATKKASSIEDYTKWGARQRRP